MIITIYNYYYNILTNYDDHDLIRSHHENHLGSTTTWVDPPSCRRAALRLRGGLGLSLQVLLFGLR